MVKFLVDTEKPNMNSMALPRTWDNTSKIHWLKTSWNLHEKRWQFWACQVLYNYKDKQGRPAVPKLATVDDFFFIREFWFEESLS